MKKQILFITAMSITAWSGFSVPAKAQMMDNCAPVTFDTGASGCGTMTNFGSREATDAPVQSESSNSGTSVNSHDMCVSQANRSFMDCLGQMPSDMMGGAALGAATGLGLTTVSGGVGAVAVPDLMIQGAIGGGVKRLSQCGFQYGMSRAECSVDYSGQSE